MFKLFRSIFVSQHAIFDATEKIFVSSTILRVLCKTEKIKLLNRFIDLIETYSKINIYGS